MRHWSLFFALFLCFTTPVFGAVELDADSNGATDVGKGGTNATTAANARTNLGVPATASTLAGSCTVGPCLDGTSDGGDLIKLYGPGGFWTSLQAGNAVANRSWRLPLAAAPGAGTTRLMNMDENGQMGFVDPATFAAALGADDNYVTDAEKIVIGNTSGSNTGDQTISDTAYDATSWDANTDAATKNAIRDKIESLAGGHDAVSINATANGLSVDGSQVLTLGLASTSTIGALSDTDWDTFNNKVSYTPATPGAIGGTTPAAGTFTTITAAEINSSAADGSRTSVLPNNTTIAPQGGGVEEIYNEGGAIKAVENDTEYDIMLSRDIGTAIQAYDADLDDLADGTLTASKVAGSTVTTGSKAAAYTIGTDSANESYGGTIYVTSTATITAPAVVTGMNFSVVTIGDIAVSLDLNAADKMILDGVTLADGDQATNSSKSGDTITCQYYSADGFYCWSGTVLGAHWTDGN